MASKPSPYKSSGSNRPPRSQLGSAPRITQRTPPEIVWPRPGGVCTQRRTPPYQHRSTRPGRRHAHSNRPDNSATVTRSRVDHLAAPAACRHRRTDRRRPRAGPRHRNARSCGVSRAGWYLREPADTLHCAARGPRGDSPGVLRQRQRRQRSEHASGSRAARSPSLWTGRPLKSQESIAVAWVVRWLPESAAASAAIVGGSLTDRNSSESASGPRAIQADRLPESDQSGHVE